jgi:site-specific DNA-methyltransferase (adenine-specific)
MIQPYYEQDGITIYHGDCRAMVRALVADVLVTDPPYLGREDLFKTDGVPTVVEDLATRLGGFVFWPVFGSVPGTPTATHVWHKAIPIHPNSEVGNVAGHQYERILDYGISKKCEVFRVAAVIPNFAPCRSECVDHPTQKPEALMRVLIARTDGVVIDPYMGSGTTLVSAKRLGRKAIGIEIEERYCEMAVRRLAQRALPLKMA